MPEHAANSKLTHDEVRRYVGFFGNAALEALAKGPLPEEEGAERTEKCRVCQILKPVAGDTGPAAALLDWHDFTGESYKLLVRIAKRDMAQALENAVGDEVIGLVGDCSYARCLAIYFAAAAELEQRRRSNVEEGLTPEGDPPQDAYERRADQEAEAAERRLDAEKAGDL